MTCSSGGRDLNIVGMVSSRCGHKEGRLHLSDCAVCRGLNMKFQDRRRLVVAITCGGLACLMGLGMFFYFFSPSEASVATKPGKVSEPAAAFGPGVFPDPAAVATNSPPANPPVARDTDAPAGLETTSDKRLVLNRALRDVFDYHLTSGHPGSRPEHRDQLLKHLESTLPARAFGEAAKIVDKYIAYLDAFSQMFQQNAVPAAGEGSNASPLDPERLSEYYAQRTRLRQTMLGIELTEIWFGEEEAEDRDYVTALRENRPEPPIQQDARQQGLSRIAALQKDGASLNAQRQEMEKQFGPEAAARFDSFIEKENEWNARYAAYRAAADDIRSHLNHDPDRLESHLAALRAQKFSQEPEQMRARALDIIAASGVNK
jgi:lipase chaperone LimK